MKLFAWICIVLVVLAAIATNEAEGYGHKKKLKIKHVWKKGGHGKYGHGYGHGKKLVGYSKRYQHMKHKGKGHY